MPYTTINKFTDHFNNKLYTGTGYSNAITGVGFQPDWVWLKKRSGSGNNFLTDVVRGVTKTIYSDATSAEATQSQGLTAFGADGFTVGTNTNVNGSSATYVSWNWKAANSAGSTNDDGNVTSTVSANTTAGFSIVKWTGTGSDLTVGHGLGVAPDVVIVKNYDNGGMNWVVRHVSLGNSSILKLNTNETPFSNTNYIVPTATTFSGKASTALSTSGEKCIAYCFAEKTGYSKFGSYTGNGSNDGTFIFCGFKPAFIITKNTSDTYHWNTNDAARDPINVASKRLYPSSGNEEVTSSNYYLDFLSNGFKIRTSHASINNSGHTFAYLAFGQSLVGSNDIPCTAR